MTVEHVQQMDQRGTRRARVWPITHPTTSHHTPPPQPAEADWRIDRKKSINLFNSEESENVEADARLQVFFLWVSSQRKNK